LEEHRPINIIVRFLSSYGAYSLSLKYGGKNIYKHEFYFVDAEDAENHGKEIFRVLGIDATFLV